MKKNSNNAFVVVQLWILIGPWFVLQPGSRASAIRPRPGSQASAQTVALLKSIIALPKRIIVIVVCLNEVKIKHGYIDTAMAGQFDNLLAKLKKMTLEFLI